MQPRLGILGLGLVLAFVAGSLAENPIGGPSPDRAVSPERISGVGLQNADTPLQLGSAGELIGFSGFDGSGSQTITLVHTRKMQIAVYHIDRSGRIDLVSSRPIDADFSLTLNATDPLPGQIRLLSGEVK